MRICPNLALEQALHEALLYVGEFIPIDVFFMEYFDAESSAARTIARADRTAGVSLDLLAPIPADVHLDEEMKSQTMVGKAAVFNHPSEISMASTMLRFHGYDEHNTSLLTMRLIDEGEAFGGLVALAVKRDAFTDEHARLLTSLAQPFTIALVNALQHRDVLLTKDRLVDENELFRNMTTRICGNLVLEEGLRACMEYLTGHIPGYVMYLQRFDHELGAMRLVARADTEKGERMDTLVPPPATARHAMKQAREEFLLDNLPPVLVFNDPENEPITRAMLDTLHLPLSSVMSLPLIVGDQPAGALALLAEGSDRFNEDHVRLYSTLKVPFFVAVSNTLRHMEVLELPERLNRRFALIRNNSLFFGSDDGAERGAAAFSVILSCYRIGLDPWEYLRDVLLKLNSTDFPQSRLEELLPENWAKQPKTGQNSARTRPGPNSSSGTRAPVERIRGSYRLISQLLLMGGRCRVCSHRFLSTTLLSTCSRRSRRCN